MIESISRTGSYAHDSRLALKQIEAVISDEDDLIANLANASALLSGFLDDVNWVGFYLTKNNLLVLGPFQGAPACVRIPWGKGVCGTAAATGATQKVADVSSFPGHIACDATTRSEIVVPLTFGGNVVGVLDIDSPIPNRFTDEDQEFMESVGVLISRCWERCHG